MRAAVPEALSVGLPGGDPAACLARLRHHWALDTWRRLGLGVGFGLGLKLGSELGLANPNPTPNHGAARPRPPRTRYAPRCTGSAPRARKELRHLRLSAFLTELSLRVELRAPAPGDEMARVAQVTARTNQVSAALPGPLAPPVTPPTLTRRTALTHRTPPTLNPTVTLTHTLQMNLTLLRFGSEHEIACWLAAGVAAAAHPTAHPTGHSTASAASAAAAAARCPDAAAAPPSTSRWIVAAWVSDRYGAYGLVGCVLCSLLNAEGVAEGVAQGAAAEGVAVVEGLNMSCRVLQRGVELSLLKRAAREARAPNPNPNPNPNPYPNPDPNPNPNQARARGAAWIALPLVCSSGQRKGNMLMQRFVARLRAWHAQGGTGGGADDAPAPATAPAGAGTGALATPPPPPPPRAALASLRLGAYGDRRGVLAPAGALVLRAEALEAMDVAAWLDAEAEAEVEVEASGAEA
eukprot:scaffold64034_cov41-Phaeocystis_antarctica.AAC.1